MKPILFGAFGCLLAFVTGDAAAAPLQTDVAIFAALTVSTDQSARVVISNVSTSGDGTNVAPCQVRVRFFGPDGSLADQVAELQLKPGKSRAVTVSHPLPLLRASVGVGSNAEVSKACELIARVEVFDVQTGTTFVSVAADPSIGHSECASSSVAESNNLGQDITSAIRPRKTSTRYRTRSYRRHREAAP